MSLIKWCYYVYIYNVYIYIYIYIYIYKKQWITLPWSMTSMRSLSSTVLILWAIVSIVQCWKPSLMVCWIMLSVSESIDAVASSSRMIYEHYSIRHFKSKEYFRGYSGCLGLTFELRRSALAIHMSYRSPTEKFSPFSTTGEYNFSGSLAIYERERKRGVDDLTPECLSVSFIFYDYYILLLFLFSFLCYHGPKSERYWEEFKQMLRLCFITIVQLTLTCPLLYCDFSFLSQ